MAHELWTNNATTTLNGAITSGATSLVVQTGAGALFPNPTGGDFFYCTLQSASGSTIEIIKVTARSGDTFSTIVRAQQGTAASAFSSGDECEHRWTAGGAQEFPQLAANDTVTGTWTFSGNMKEATITFDSTLNLSKVITVTDAGVTASSHIIITPSNNAPVGGFSDEWAMDHATFAVLPQSGQFILTVNSDKAPIIGPRKIFYMYG